MHRITLLASLVVLAAVSFAQDAAPKSTAPATQDAAKASTAADNPLTTFNKRAFTQMKAWLNKSADKMPEENYAFKPTDSVRSFGQIIGHLADAQYMFCSGALGEQTQPRNIEKTKTTKADLTAALKEAFAYCDKAYDGMTDAAGAQTVKFHGNDMAKFSLLQTNLMHDAEHYGNLVTYMRLKNIVPPSTEQAAAQQQQKK